MLSNVTASFFISPYFTLFHPISPYDNGFFLCDAYATK